MYFREFFNIFRAGRVGQGKERKARRKKFRQPKRGRGERGLPAGRQGRKNRRAQIKNCEENFFAGQRAERAAAGRSVQNSQSVFSSKKVRILSKRYRQNLNFPTGGEGGI